MTRVAVVGLGWVARQVWLPELDAHPEFELVGGVDPDPRARAEAAERVGELVSQHVIPRPHDDLVALYL